MSRIGRQPINIPAGVEVTVADNLVNVKGPKGELSEKILKGLEVTKSDDQVVISQKVINPDTQKQFGLQRTLVNNMIIGVSEGFKKELEINGVGFRAQMKGSTLEMSLGFSHPVEFNAPDGVELVVNQNIITVTGFDKQKVGATAANIRMLKKPEPYKGKGIKYIDEHIRRKAGKTAAKGGSE